MTLIDKAEALAALETVWRTMIGGAEVQRKVNAAIRAIPARGVGVKPLVWEPSAINKPWHSAKAPWGWYYAQWDDETQAWFASLEMGEVEAPIIMSPSDVPTIDAAKAAAQADYEARILAALAPTDAAHVNETPKSEHDAGNVLTAAQAREAALSEHEDDKYLILKRGMYYRPGSKGYTSSPSEAGRYTLAQAVFLTHPNGPDGPRDGMSFVPLSVALIGEPRT